MANRTAYFISATDKTEDGEFIPCIAVEGEAGYHRTDWHWGTDLELAEKCAVKKNAALEIDEKTALVIVLSTMRKAPIKGAGKALYNQHKRID